MIALQRSRRAPGRPAPWAEDFAAFGWRAVLGVDHVEVAVRAEGAVRLWAGTGKHRELVAAADVDQEWSASVMLGDRAWLWVEGDVTEVEWRAAVEPVLPHVTAVVPTFGRPDDAVTQTTALLAADVVGHVVVIDQAGGLDDVPQMRALLESEPDRVVLVEQANLGGSGGYARGMLESLRWPDDAVFLSDDDAAIDAESLRRMVVLQTLAASRGERCMVGSGMLAAEEPDVLVSLAERIERRRFWWCPADGLSEPVSVGERDPEVWNRMVPSHRADYGSWWGTLLPPGTVAELGLPAPYFLKWDDAEYGLRARRRGWVVRTLPGVAVRHPTWAAKGTSSGWASLPLHRNRLTTAAAYRAGHGVLLDSAVHQVKHVLSLQYGTATAWQAAVHQVLRGPSTWLGTDLLHVRDDAQRLLDESDATQSRGSGGSAVHEAPPDHDDGGPPAPLVGALRALTGLWRPPSSRDRVRRVERTAFTWRDGLGADRVLLVDGDQAAVLQRDPRRARRLLADVLASHLRLALRWPSLRRAYSGALPAVTTATFWRRTIGLEPDGRTGPSS